MRVMWGGAALAVLVVCCAGTAPAQAAADEVQPLNQYVVTGGDRSNLADQGFDVTEGRSAKGGRQGIVATPEQADALRAQGFTVTAPYGEVKKAFAPPNPFPTTKLDYGYDVYRPWRLVPGDCPNACGGATDGNGNPVNLKTWYEAQRTAHPDMRNGDQPGGTGTQKVLKDTVIAVRDYLNDGGKLLVTGQQALAAAWGNFAYNPLGTDTHSFCNANTTDQDEAVNVPPGQSEPCQPVSDDFIQYWLGAYTSVTAANGDDVASLLFNRAGGVFGTTAFNINGADSAGNQASVLSLVPTSDILPRDVFPQFDLDVVDHQAGPAGLRPVRRHALRLREVERRVLPAAGPHARPDERAQRAPEVPDVLRHGAGLRLRVRGGAHGGPGRLDDAARLNGQTSTDVGESCDIDWNTIHPFLDHYQTNPTPAADCTNHGTTGAWNGATANSNSWHQWDVDLSAYAGKQVEIAITYAQDFATAGLGVFLDEVQVTGVDAQPEGFENGTLGAWTAGPPPAGTQNQAGWVASTSVGFTDGPGVATKQTEFWGFGLEGVRGVDQRAALLGDALHYLASTVVPVPSLQPVTQVSQTTTVTGTVPPPPQGGVLAASTGKAAQKPRIVLAKRYGATRSGRVTFRVSCASTVACTGVLKLVRGGKGAALKSYTVKAGGSSAVTLRLKHAAFRQLKRADRLRFTLRLYMGHTKVVKSSTVTLREP